MKNLTEILTAQIRRINDRYVATVHEEIDCNEAWQITHQHKVWDDCMSQIEAIYDIATAAGCVWNLRDDNCRAAQHRIINNFNRAYTRKRNKKQSAA
jgi:hypothetical protein